MGHSRDRKAQGESEKAGGPEPGARSIARALAHQPTRRMTGGGGARACTQPRRAMCRRAASRSTSPLTAGGFRRRSPPPAVGDGGPGLS